MTQVAIILGSSSDLKAIEESELTRILDEVGVSWTLSIISAHRHPLELEEYCVLDSTDNLVFIGVAGMAAALPGVIAAYAENRPVIGVPLVSDVFDGLDALLSMVRMPSGRPVSVCGIGKSGLYNAAILACQVIALADPEIRDGLEKFLEKNTEPPKITFKTSK